MTRSAFEAALTYASVPGRMSIVRMVAPMRDGLPERHVLERVLGAFRDPDVEAIVLVKAEEAA